MTHPAPMFVRPFVLVVVLLGLVACVARDAPQDFRTTINVVAVVPLTGKFAAKGPEHRAAIQMALRDLEAAGGVLGKPFQLHVVDAGESASVCKERVAAIVAQLTDPSDGTVKVAAFISSTTAGLKGTAPIALALGVPHLEISSGSGLDEVTLDATADRSYEFATRPLCMPEPEVTAQLLGDKAGLADWDTIVVMHGGEFHDQMHADMLRMHLTMHGYDGRILNPVDLVMEDDVPYDDHFDAVMAMPEVPDVIYYHLNGDEKNVDFIKSAERTGYPGKIITCGMARKKSLLAPVDPGIADYMEGRVYFMMRGPVKSDRLTRFRVDFEAFSGYVAETYSPSAYDAAMLVGLALADAGSEQGPAVRAALLAVSAGGTKVDYGAAGDALALIAQGADLDYDGASGDLAMNMDPILGHVITGRFYVETVIVSATAVEGYDFKTLDAPDEEL